MHVVPGNPLRGFVCTRCMHIDNCHAAAEPAATAKRMRREVRRGAAFALSLLICFLLVFVHMSFKHSNSFVHLLFFWFRRCDVVGGGIPERHVHGASVQQDAGRQPDRASTPGGNADGCADGCPRDGAQAPARPLASGTSTHARTDAPTHVLFRTAVTKGVQPSVVQVFKSRLQSWGCACLLRLPWCHTYIGPDWYKSILRCHRSWACGGWMCAARL